MFGISELERALVDVEFFSRIESIKTVDCILLGADCPLPQIVPVPIHKGYEVDFTAIDLEFQQYINISSTPYNGVIRFNDHVMEVGHISLRGRTRKCPFKFIIFVGDNSTDGPNNLVRAITGISDLTVKGNLLIAKEGGDGLIIPMTDRDLCLLEAIVAQ
ncbi:hypothetical protein BKA70DRAFT_1228157 [Coprinopsis sp. MPI-PUGE-AT-0042]|nr:hypothetical protein BKA70DRAFT_1228157 [Coprinopsis sp. MPI-PUGE-AT-0042]